MLDKFLLGTTRDFKFPTVAPSTGVPTTLAGSPVISAYPDNGTTQITAGITLSVDFDSVTGMHNVRVVATAANGYDYGVKYTLVITTGTVDSVSAVGNIVGEFVVYPSVIPELGVSDYGALQSATSTTAVLRSALAYPDDQVIGSTLFIYAGTGAGGSGIISDYVSSTDTATVAFPTTPDGTSQYMLFASPQASSDLPVPARMQGILSTDFTESTAGRMAGNMETFYDNSDSATTKTVDDVGVAGSGLTQQNVRDAMKLAPTAGSPAAGSVDEALDTAQADLDIITDSDGVVLGSAGVDLVWDEVLTGGTHNIVNSAGRRLRQIEASFVVHSGTAQAGSSNTITLAGDASSSDNIYRGDRVVIVDGTGQQEHGIITAYNGTTKVATMAQNWVITPDATSEYEVGPADCDIETWQHNVVTGDGDWAELQTAADAVQAKTDDITFSKANEVDVNIKSVIDDTVQASSSKTTDWGGTP